jgi:hypothetical protein
VKQELTTSADSIELQPTSNLQDYIAKLIQWTPAFPRFHSELSISHP